MSGEMTDRFVADRPLMTIRVSRDSGRTWGETTEVRDADVPPFDVACWPPCQCSQHRGNPASSRAHA